MCINAPVNRGNHILVSAGIAQFHLKGRMVGSAQSFVRQNGGRTIGGRLRERQLRGVIAFARNANRQINLKFITRFP